MLKLFTANIFICNIVNKVNNFQEKEKNALIYNNNYQNSFYEKLKQGMGQRKVWIYQYKFLIHKRWTVK